MSKLPDIEFLNTHFTANFTAGILTRRGSGKRGCTVRKDGYCTVGINYKKYYVHRIMWKMYYGTEPKNIDHIDGNPSNNSISNLRSVEAHENSKNQKLHKNNTSGVSGVWQQENRWRSRIMHKKKIIDLGIFDTKEAAIAARAAAEKAFSYHSNHGRQD